ncbi:MAG TPA: hypothetical protein VGE40_02170 [Bacilli bacterium]
MNVLELPKNFDYNEWMIIISLIATYTFAFRLPKRFPQTITILIVLFSFSLEKSTDLILEYPPYTLYYLNDSTLFELSDFFTCFLYPVFGYILLHYYDKWNIRGISNFFFILAGSIFGTLFEWITVLAHVFEYTGWKLEYSFTVYLLVISLYIVFFNFVKKFFIRANLKNINDLP